MRIGISFWGICQSFVEHRFNFVDTPDGHRYGRPLFVDELLARGHTVHFMQQHGRDVYRHGQGVVAADDGFPDIDILFCEWRWPTWKNDRNHPQHDPSRYEPDIDRQTQLLKKYHGNIPIILWDTDLKINVDDEKRWPQAIVADPSLKTNRLTRDRHSLPFWTDFQELFPVAEPYPVYGYIGNNYERDNEFRDFYFMPAERLRSKGIQTSMYGNWLQRSPERVSPEELIIDNRNVTFNHRMNFYDSMRMMNRFIVTTHVSKYKYYFTGFISPRYLEALAANCPALIPWSMLQTLISHGKYGCPIEMVNDCHGVIENVLDFAKLSIDGRAALVQEQREWLRATGLFSVQDVVDWIESCV